MRAHDFRRALELLGRRSPRVPLNSRNSVGCSGSDSFEYDVAGPHLHLVEELDACERRAGLDELDDGVDRAAQVGKCADARCRPLRAVRRGAASLR